MAQVRDKVTVLERGTVRVYERFEVAEAVTPGALRGIGAKAYRLGFMIPGAIKFAADHVGRELTGGERELVAAGWRDERAEMVGGGL